MYKTITVPEPVFLKINTHAAREKKPKSVFLAELVALYEKNLAQEEHDRTRKSNLVMDSLASGYKLPDGTRIRAEELNRGFDVLEDV